MWGVSALKGPTRRFSSKSTRSLARTGTQAAAEPLFVVHYDPGEDRHWNHQLKKYGVQVGSIIAASDLPHI